jgi:hypothetical protein
MKKRHKTDPAYVFSGPASSGPGDLRSEEAFLFLAQGYVLEHITRDVEAGLLLILRVWFSSRCSCCHFAVNSIFRGVYTGPYYGFRKTHHYGRDVVIVGPGVGRFPEDRVCLFY